MDTPSDEAVQTYMEYFQRNTRACRFLPFLKDLIYFLVNDFDIKNDAYTLPTAMTEVTISEGKVRAQAVDRLLDEFKDDFDDPLSEEEGLEGYAYVKRGIPTVLLENTEMFPRRRPGSRSSACELGPISTEPAAPQTTTEAHQSEHALGFTDIYGSLTPRQVSIITIGSAIGTGLMVGTGRALSMSGPAAIIISYTIVGFAVYLVLSALGEVGSWLPKPYTVADQAVRFCHPALGFSLGWIFWLKYAVVTPNQLTAAALVVSYWVGAERVNPGIWITVFLSIIVALNFVNHRLPSKIEFYVSSFKLVVMLGLMILSTVIALGGGPDQEAKGFRYWSHPGAFGAQHHRDHGLLEKFYITCSTMSSATFAYIGSERSGLAHFPNVRKATSRAIQNTFYRIMVFHLLAITLLGMIVPP
ncbi:Amino acid/polyamine transporter I [Penicillium chrysogenum]|nr:Amino acid/polyamine transporter I [Penicillium chrysogenum]